MPRNGSGVYSLPAGSTITNGDVSDATDLNTPFQDLETDMNTVRPVVAGGTGASSASAARTNLGLVIGTDVLAYDADVLFADVNDTVTADWTISGTFTVTGTLDLSGGTLTLANDQIGGVKVAAATDTTRGTVEKSTSAENVAGTATDKFPDVAGVKEMVDTHGYSEPGHLEVGDFVFARLSTLNVSIALGDEIDGASLYSTGITVLTSGNGNQFTSGTGTQLTGGQTWKAKGSCDGRTSAYAATVWKRIS